MKRIEKLNRWNKLSDKERSDKIANELSIKEKEMLLGLVTQAIEEIGLGEMEYLEILKEIENKLDDRRG